MKKIFTFKKPFALLLVFTLFFTISPLKAQASTYFNSTELSQIYSAGFPYNYRGHIDRYYEAMIDVAIPLFEEAGYYYSEYDYFDLFLDFCTDTCKVKTKQEAINLQGGDFTFEFSRAFYFEVSDLDYKVIGMKGIPDCMANRVYSNTDSDYIEACFGLDGLNDTKTTTYWHSIMLNPVADSAAEEAYDALVAAYSMASVISNEIYDLGAEAGDVVYYHRWTDSLLITSISRPLPWGYNFFDETSGAGRIRIGDFYFRMTY